MGDWVQSGEVYLYLTLPHNSLISLDSILAIHLLAQ